MEEVKVHLPLNNRPVFHLCDGGHTFYHAGRVALHRKARGRNRSLRDGINSAIGARQGGDKESAAAQARRITEGGDGDVDRGTPPGKRWQFGCHHDRSGVLGLKLVAIQVCHAKAFQHPTDGFTGERA